MKREEDFELIEWKFAPPPPSCANYFKIMQIFTRNWVYTPDFGLKISTPRFKSLRTGLK